MTMPALPNEIWALIFEFMKHPADLSRVARTCARFYLLAIRPLYEHIVWRDPRHLASNLSFWTDRPRLPTIPSTVVVNMRPFMPYVSGVAFVTPDGSSYSWIGCQTIVRNVYLEDNAADLVYCMSRKLQDSMLNLICSFTHLRELTFRNTHLPDQLHVILRCLPLLRGLHFESCTFRPQSQMDQGTLFESLPLEEVTVIDLKLFITLIPGSSSNTSCFPLYFALGQRLRALKMDWAPMTARIFTRLRNRVSQHIGRLDFVMMEEKGWDKLENASRLTEPLSLLLQVCPSVMTLRIANHLPHFELPSSALPRLHSYTGPLSSVLAFAGSSRQLEHLCITNCDWGLKDLTNKLSVIAQARHQLQTLTLEIPHWDDEVLHSVTQLFTDLRALEIKFLSGSPSEYTLLSMGSEFLIRTPQMHTLRIYIPSFRPGISSRDIEHWSDDDSSSNEEGVYAVSSSLPPPVSMLRMWPMSMEDLEDILPAWNRWCPQLREVQLRSSYVWRRASASDLWTRRELA